MSDREPKKMCAGCREVKPFSDFSRDRSLKSGRRSRCRRCVAAQRDREAARRHGREWKARNADKLRAHKKLWYAVSSGAVQRPKSCENCGVAVQEVVILHEDYAQPLDVLWLCSRCHGELHGARRRAMSPTPKDSEPTTWAVEVCEHNCICHEPTKHTHRCDTTKRIVKVRELREACDEEGGT